MDDFESLKRKVAEATSRKDKAAGAYGEVMKRIQERYGCKTLEEAKLLLKKRRKKELATANDYTEKKEGFEKEFKKALEEFQKALEELE